MYCCDSILYLVTPRVRVRGQPGPAWSFWVHRVALCVFCCLRACVKLERLRLSRQVVQLEYVRLTDCFKEPGWATTCRCDTTMSYPGQLFSFQKPHCQLHIHNQMEMIDVKKWLFFFFFWQKFKNVEALPSFSFSFPLTLQLKKKKMLKRLN